MSEAVFIGIDVSRDTLEVGSSAKAATWRHGNDSAGIEALTAELLALGPALVVLEATGGYEFEAACALQAAGLAVAVVNPRQARDFARAMGALAKTDSLDARMLAGFARVLHQHPERERNVQAAGRRRAAAAASPRAAPAPARGHARRRAPAAAPVARQRAPEHRAHDRVP
jgi:transposase